MRMGTALFYAILLTFTMSTVAVTVGNGHNVTYVGTTSIEEQINTIKQTSVEKYLLICQNGIFGTGLLGNMFSFIIFSRKNLRSSVNSILFQALAVSDTIALTAAWLQAFLKLAFNTNITDISIWYCRFYMSILTCFTLLSAWIITFIAIDRSYAISVPHKYKMVFTRNRLFCTLIIAIFLSAALHSFNIYGLDILQLYIAEINGYIILCTAPARYAMAYNIYLWIGLFSYNIIPSAIIVLCNACIIYKACLSNKNFQHGEGHSSRLTGMTATLMLVSISHLLLSAPVCFTQILYRSHMISSDDFAFMINISVVLGEINNAINFILYCITGSKFRQEIKFMFKKKM